MNEFLQGLSCLPGGGVGGGGVHVLPVYVLVYRSSTLVPLLGGHPRGKAMLVPKEI